MCNTGFFIQTGYYLKNYLFTRGTDCKTAFQSLKGADYQPEIRKRRSTLLLLQIPPYISQINRKRANFNLLQSVLI